MLKQGLQQSIAMQQKLSPMQIQTIRMLESTTVEMEERIRQELDDNPALESDGCLAEHEESEIHRLDVDETDPAYDDADLSMSDYQDYSGGGSKGEGEDNTPDASPMERDRDGENGQDIDYEPQDYEEDARYNEYSDSYGSEAGGGQLRDESLTSAGAALCDYLQEQIQMRPEPKKIRDLAEYVVGNLDQDGYLRREAESMIDDIAFQTGAECSEKDMSDAIALIRQLEPAGVGAHDLRDCLELQLSSKAQTQDTANALRIVAECFEELSRKHYDKIMRKLDLTVEELKDATAEIMKLNPKPGSNWDSGVASNSLQIIPDFIVERDGDDLILTLNDRNVPELHLSPTFAEQLDNLQKNKNLSESKKKDALYLKQKVDTAKWFITSVKQRQTTLKNTMMAIIRRQKQFFLTGDDTKLVPMVLKDIAADTALDISTISRVSNSKYVLTDFGMYQLKFFFSESMSTESGDDVSNTEVKRILQELIDGEDKKRPLTDDRISEILKERGYIIARRTVAKYRNMLGFGVASLRKEL